MASPTGQQRPQFAEDRRESDPVMTPYPNYSRWSASSASCWSEPGGSPVQRVKLPPRKSSKQSMRPVLDDKDHLPPLPLERKQLISAFAETDPSERPSLDRSESPLSCASSASSTSSKRSNREKRVIPPPVNTALPCPAIFHRPRSPLPEASPTSPFHALLLRPIQASLPFV